MNNLQADGWDLSDLKYISLSKPEAELYRLVPGDILFNRTNGSRDLVGKCEVFQETGHWVFASYLIRMQINEQIAYPEFVAAFLNMPAGRLQIDKVSRQILMSNINLEEIKSLLIPLPNKDVQRKLLDKLEDGRSSRLRKLAEANKILSGLDLFLLRKLGIEPLPIASEVRVCFAAKLGELRSTGRLNTEFYHPERELAIQSLRSGKNKAVALRDIAEFVRDLTTVTSTSDYIGLAHVQRDTGELLELASEEIDGAAFHFRTGDVLFARLRPYLNKVYRAERNGVCSTEFHVVRGLSDADGNPIVQPDYLATVLRSSLVVAQTRHMMTGNTHPRLANDDVINLIIPVPSLSDQTAVVAEVVRRREKARQLREEAATEWASAKERFESHLLG